MNLFHALLFWLITTICKKSGKADGNFDRKHTTITFSPFVSYDHIGRAKIFKDGSEFFPMFKKIQTEFDIIAILLTTNLDHKIDDIAMIPSAVATFNKLLSNHSKYRPLQVWFVDVMDDVTNAGLNYTSRLSDLKDLANNANSIFPGTITHLFLEYSYFDKASLDEYKVEKEVLETKKIWKDKGDYKFGVIRQMGHCEPSSENLFTSWAYIFENVDMIAFHWVPDREFFKLRSKLLVEHFTQEFDVCLDFLSKGIQNRSLPVAFYSACPDTNNDGLTSYKNQVNFFTEISKWSAAKGSHVIFEYAFDAPFFEQPMFVTRGWWRLVENGSYNSTADFVFQAKANFVEDHDDGPKSYMENYSLINPSKDISFRHPSFQVSFDLFRSSVDRLRKIYPNNSQITQQLELVTKKFQKLYLYSSWDFERVDLIKAVANSLANINLRRRGNTCEIVLPVGGAGILDKIGSFETIKGVAKDANKIFPNTVTTLVTNAKFSKDDTDILTQLSFLEYASIPNNKENFQLAIKLPLKDCNGPINELPFQDKIAPFINSSSKSVDIIILDMENQIQAMRLGVSRIFSRATAMADSCKRKIRTVAATHKRKIQVALFTDWSDIDDTGTRNYAPLVNYWEMLSEWSSKMGTSVILAEAFDDKDKEGVAGSRGWFQFIQDDKYRSITDYKFVEKKSLALQLIKTNSKKLQEGNLGTPLVATIGVLVVACMGVIVVLLGISIKRRNKKYLTSHEMDEFFNGGKNSTELYNGAYHKNLFEQDRDSFTVDEEKVLGAGEFGKVCCGRLKLKPEHYQAGSDEGEMEIAIKMTKASGSSTTGLKGLLSEIKVLSYLGRHENIVVLMGAYTARLKRGQLYVFLELCGEGSLLSYLRRCNPRNCETQNDDADSDVDEHLRRDLDRWSKDIVRGMEFLASKRVVHADLATRNILLTTDKRAKISDFGLSRRLYNYSLYVKNQQEPLPWRWMAPEALRLQEFTEKTDVWSFGVTLWEIYSLGGVPYPGESWQEDFLAKLERGALRLEEPPYSPPNMYFTMLKCWHAKPTERPTFQQLNGHLK